MADQEAVIRRRALADARIDQAVAALAEANGVEAATMPQLPREVDSDFRQMIEREVLADTLERLASANGPDIPPELLAEQDAADERVRLAIVALAEANEVSDLGAIAYPSDATFAEQRVATTQAVAAALESVVKAATGVDIGPSEVPGDASDPVDPVDPTAKAIADVETAPANDDPLPDGVTVEYVPPADGDPDLSKLSRDDLDALATSLGIESPEKLPNKAAVVAAITDAKKG